MQSYESKSMPRAFFWRRLQSLMGFFLILFLIEHFLTNSQAALFFGSDGIGFIKSVNAIRELPYLPVIEILLIALPFVIHMIWGVMYLLTSKDNSYWHTEKDPYLPKYPKNRAYTWQRITSWILLVGIIWHVVDMRFINYPKTVKEGIKSYYTVSVTDDPGLHTLSERLGVKLLADKEKKSELMSLSPNFGTAELLIVREVFKSPLMIALYTLFVLAATYHACNGLWTFCITWGITLTARSQYLMRIFVYFLMGLVGFLGLIAVWGSTFINLKD